MNVKKLINTLDPESYINDMEKHRRVRFISKVLEARLTYNLQDTELIKNSVLSGLDFDVDFVDFNNFEMPMDEVNWCSNMVSNSLQYGFIYDEADKMIDLMTKLKSTDYSHRGDIVQIIRAEVANINNQFRLTDSKDNVTDVEFSLRDDQFEKSVTTTYNLITNPSRKLVTGMQGLNEMLGGGFESGRCYMFLGLTGIGKSITLLNIAYQIKKYNVFYKPKDPTKTPCVVILTMENTVVETIQRLFDLVVPNGMGMANYTLQEVLYKLRTEGELKISEDSPIDILIRYKANGSEDTSYLYTLYDDLSDEGYEMICLIQDHVKRIRSVTYNPDKRIELGDIVNEFKAFAAIKDIPVITNSHLNRDASRIVEDAGRRTNRVDITMRLGKSNTGESFLMLDNLDGGIVINIDFDEEGNKYMAFKLEKHRYKPNIKYFVHPFEYGSSIRLKEDVGGIPLFVESLHANGDIHRNTNMRMSSSNTAQNIQNIINFDTFENAPLAQVFPSEDIDDMDETPNFMTSQTIPLENPKPEKKIIKVLFFESMIPDKPNLDDLPALNL